MAELQHHAVMIRTLINHHAENINGKDKDDKNNKEICAACFEDVPRPKHPSQATFQTQLPPKIK